MRIAVWHNLPSGGGKRALYHHVAGLVARGHHVETWCPPTANRDFQPLSAFGPEHVVAYAKPAAPDPPRALGRYRQWKRELAALDRHCQACAEEIHAGGFDVLFAGNCLETAVSPVARHVRLPSLLYTNEPKRWLYEARPRLPWAAPPVAQPAGSVLHRFKEALRDYDASLCVRVEAREERASAEAFTMLLSNSAFSRESILRAYGLDSRVCYLGIDTGLFHPAEGAREGYVVGLGGIQPHKGVELAVEALATVPTARRPPLVWIGNVVDPAYENELRQLAARREVNLTMRHLLSEPELVDSLRRAALMIYTSHLEPFGFAPLEANACGTPVVAVAEGGVRETVIHRVNGLLVPDRDPTALGQAVAELVDQPELARRLGETGAEIVRQQWTWEKSVERLERSLLSLVKRA